jgi:hypothetical protein
LGHTVSQPVGEVSSACAVANWSVGSNCWLAATTDSAAAAAMSFIPEVLAFTAARSEVRERILRGSPEEMADVDQLEMRGRRGDGG